MFCNIVITVENGKMKATISKGEVVEYEGGETAIAYGPHETISADEIATILKGDK